MANICSNDYHFIFSDAEKAKKFLDFVESSDHEGSVYEMGIKANIKDAENRDVREWVQSAYVVSPTAPNEIGVMTDSKWTPYPNAWEDIAKTFDENVTVYYEAEEPGCEIYASNDPDYVGRFIIDVCDDSEFPEGVSLEWGPHSREETISALQKLLETDDDDMSALLRKLVNSKYSEAVYVHEIEYTPISDWAL